jgi:hypothetical protein
MSGVTNDDLMAAIYDLAPKCAVCREHVTTRTVGYDDCTPVTLRRVCDRIACTLGLPVSGTLPHAEVLRAANASQGARR